MKRNYHWLAMLLMGTMSALGEVQVGQPAPEFTGTDIQGKVHHLHDYQGKIVVLEAYNRDCPFVMNHYHSGAMQALQGMAVQKGVAWLMINSVNKASPSYLTPGQADRQYRKEHMKATAWIDDHSGEIGHLYGMKTTPHLFVINPKGVLVYDGAIDDRAAASGDPRTAHNYVKAALESLWAHQPVKVSRTRPYGCSVKYAH